MPRYDHDYEIRRRAAARRARPGPGRFKLSGPPLGYGYPADESEAGGGFFGGGGVYRGVTDRGHAEYRSLLRPRDWARLSRHSGRDRFQSRNQDRVLGRPYVGEYRARLERETYGRPLDPEDRYLPGYPEPEDRADMYRDLFRYLGPSYARGGRRPRSERREERGESREMRAFESRDMRRRHRRREERRELERRVAERRRADRRRSGPGR